MDPIKRIGQMEFLMNDIERKYPMPKWAIRQICEDGIIKDVCKCNISHPNKHWMIDHPKAIVQRPVCKCCEIKKAKPKSANINLGDM